ncbi:MAG: hypothetical protein RR825_04815, partial [Ruthenibacterium sp.]
VFYPAAVATVAGWPAACRRQAQNTAFAVKVAVRSFAEGSCTGTNAFAHSQASEKNVIQYSISRRFVL